MKGKDDFLALTPAKVVTAVERIVEACQPRSILVFGSRARGDARPDSDLDLLVLLSAPVADPLTLRRHLRGLLFDLAFAKDILVSDPEHCAEHRTWTNSVYRLALEEGFPLWQDGKLDLTAIQEVCGAVSA